MLEREAYRAETLIGGCPALVVRNTLRQLRIYDQWKAIDLETAAGLPPGAGRLPIDALQAEGLIERARYILDGLGVLGIR
jgi:hypothetical protein